MIERGEGFFDLDKLVVSPKLARHLVDIGADTWVPNPNKKAEVVMPTQKTRSRKEQFTPDLYPVWGNFRTQVLLTASSFGISWTLWPVF